MLFIVAALARLVALLAAPRAAPLQRALVLLGALLAPALPLGLYLSSGGGVQRALPAWLGAPLFTACLVLGLAAALPLHRMVVERIERGGPTAGLLAGAMVAAGVALLLADHAVLRGLYLPLHFALATGAVLLFATGLSRGSAVLRPSVRFLVGSGAAALAGLALTLLLQAHAPGMHTRAVLDGAGARQVARAAHLLRAVLPSRPIEPSPRPAPPGTGGLRWSGEAPHVIVLSLEAVRAASTSLHGHERPTTPFLASLAGRSVVFDRAYAPSSKTRFVLPALLLGRDLALEGQPCEVWREHDSLFEVFRERGYRTLCDLRHSKSRAACLVEDCDVTEDAGDRQRDFRMILEALNSNERPLLSFVHLMETHAPYSGYNEALEAETPGWSRYERSLLAMDRALAEFHRAAAAAVQRPVLWVLLGDHGEAFGEHGHERHGSSLHDEQIRVPLLLHGLALEPARITAPVSTQWLYPTLLPLAGRTPAGPTLPLDAGATPGAPVFARLEHWRAVIDGDWKLMVDQSSGARWLFDLASDPGEQRNRLADRPDEAARLSALLDRRFLD